jgi:hypothetical protein
VSIGDTRREEILLIRTPLAHQISFHRPDVSSTIVLPCAIISECAAPTKHFGFGSASAHSATTAAAPTTGTTTPTGYNTNHASPSRPAVGDSIPDPVAKAQVTSECRRSSIRTTTTSARNHDATHPTSCTHPRPSAAPVGPCYASPRLSVFSGRIPACRPPAAPLVGPSTPH